MPPKAVIALSVLVAIVLFLVIFLIVYIARQKKVRRDTQRELSDRDLLRLIDAQPDKMMHKKDVAAKTGLSPSEAGIRMQAMAQLGVLRMAYTRNMTNYYYSLTQPLREIETPELSPEPFLTVDDLLKLFPLFDYKPSYQDLVMATGLPIDVLKREMKYFEKEGIVKFLFTTNSSGSPYHRFFILEEPYRSNPDKFRQRETEMNAQLKELLRNDLMV